MGRSRCGRRSRGAAVRRRGALLALALAACARSPAEDGAVPAPGEWRSFEGSWSAAGDRRTLELGPGRQASILDVSGSLLLTGERELGVGFQARALVFSDGSASSLGRVVWTDERGDRIFSELRGAEVGTGRRVLGTITGGTGRWRGISGEYEFEWKYVVTGPEGQVQGRVVGLQGRARILPEGGAR